MEEEKVEYFRSKYSYKTRLNLLRDHNRKIVFQGNILDRLPKSHPKVKDGYRFFIIFI